VAAAAPCHGCPVASSACGASGRVDFAGGHSQLPLLHLVFEGGAKALCYCSGNNGFVILRLSCQGCLKLFQSY
jgi:hypothetical protein